MRSLILLLSFLVSAGEVEATTWVTTTASGGSWGSEALVAVSGGSYGRTGALARLRARRIVRRAHRSGAWVAVEETGGSHCSTANEAAPEVN